MGRKIITALAWLGIIILVIGTVVPANERPDTGLNHNLEHFIAFFTVAILVGLSFKVKPAILFVLAFTFCGCLELSQIPLVTRHARFEDFVVNAATAWFGITFGIFLAARKPFSTIVADHG